MSIEISEINNLFPETPVARYNVAAWKNLETGSVILVGREVEKAAEVGEPDVGTLKLFELDENQDIIHERIIWEPKYKTMSLEDPRALQLPDDNIIICLTAVLGDKHLREVFPAIVRIGSHTAWNEELPPVTIIQTFGEGKNLTPIDGSTFLFRPDQEEYHHKLLVFGYKSWNPRKIQDIEFPKDLPWALWRMGTTMSPLWINENEALLIIHGVNIIADEEESKYIYSLGRAKLSKVNGEYEVKVAKEPILTPDSFLEHGFDIEELHPKLRRVVYSCGGIIKEGKEDTLYLYVNVGDRTTFEIGIKMSDLKEGLF